MNAKKHKDLWTLALGFALALTNGLGAQEAKTSQPEEYDAQKVRVELIRIIPDYKIEEYDDYWWEHLYPFPPEDARLEENKGTAAKIIAELRKLGMFDAYEPIEQSLDAHFAKVMWTLERRPLTEFPDTPKKFKGAYNKYLEKHGREAEGGKIPWSDALTDWNEQLLPERLGKEKELTDSESEPE